MPTCKTTTCGLYSLSICSSVGLPRLPPDSTCVDCMPHLDDRLYLDGGASLYGRLFLFDRPCLSGRSCSTSTPNSTPTIIGDTITVYAISCLPNPTSLTSPNVVSTSGVWSNSGNAIIRNACGLTSPLVDGPTTARARACCTPPKSLPAALSLRVSDRCPAGAL